MSGLRMYVFTTQFLAPSARRPQPFMASNGLSAVRSGVAGNRERTVRSAAAPEAVAELGSFAQLTSHS